MITLEQSKRVISLQRRYDAGDYSVRQELSSIARRAGYPDIHDLIRSVNRVFEDIHDLIRSVNRVFKDLNDLLSDPQLEALREEVDRIERGCEKYPALYDLIAKLIVRSSSDLIWAVNRVFEDLNDLLSDPQLEALREEVDRIMLGCEKYPEIYESFAESRVGETTKNRREKRGGSRYSDEEQLDALTEWDRTDHRKVSLSDYLQGRFGENVFIGGPNVNDKTFHGWRAKHRKAGNYRHN